MTVTSDVHKTGDTVTGRVTLKNLPSLSLDEARKPVHAYVGLADLALEQARELPARYAAEARRVSALLADAPRTLPTQVKELRGGIEDRVAKVSEQAGDFYSQLAVRGERLVTSIRRQPATEAAVEEAKEAVRKAEAATTAAGKSARAGGRAAKSAADKVG